ncbi:hypothetical protein HYE53_01430, partial [Aggregatibacter actinomycetemcomitans]|nr:hypothetical protein [Aggregatibacter actinomycetemcomitans]
MERQYGADMVSRNVKQLGNGVIEISRYNFGHLKANLVWPWFLVVTAITVYDVILQKGIFIDIKWAISIDWALEDIWGRSVRARQAFNEFIPPNDYERFKAEMLEMHGHRIYRGW